MIAIPIFLFVVLLLFFVGGILLIISVIVSYISYRKQLDEKTREVIEKQYGTREKK